VKPVGASSERRRASEAGVTPEGESPVLGSKTDLNMTSRDFRLPVLTDVRFGSQSRHRPATT
jgi:hypothetical protein